MMDGAPPHIWRPVLDWFDEHFPSRVISRLRGIQWAPRSPDLTPCDYWLFGHLKSLVYSHATPVANIEELKQRIIDYSREITLETVRAALLHFRIRLECCRDAEGGHIE